MRNILLIIITLLFFNCNSRSKGEIEVASPDGRYHFVLVNKEPDTLLQYKVLYNGHEIIHPSELGVVVDGPQVIGGNLFFQRIETRSVSTSWRPPYGERSEYPENYNETCIQLGRSKQGQSLLTLIIRAYNEGVAFRYVLTDGDQISVIDEHTEFAIDPNADVWVTEMSQGHISKRKPTDIQNRVERPLLIQSVQNLFIAVGEAAQINYGRMKFIASTKPGVLKVSVKGVNSGEAPFSTPWRYIMAGQSAGEILENNYLILNLNEENQLRANDWLKPGKVIREVTLTTKGGKACVDFAAKYNLQYIHFDAGWYGHEYLDEADATTITVDPDRSKGPLELLEVISYAKSKNIEVILYVNRRALEKQLDEILPLYKSWGIRGLKYGFVRTGDQEWTSWMHEAVRKAAEYEMVLSIHDDYRPTGYSRTYPNLMTQEGIRGDEESPTNEHTLMTLFTRMIAGGADNTVCYFAPRVDEKMGSHASQLAKAVCIYSPLMWLYWYDRPNDSPRNKGGAGGSAPVIEEVPELAFFDALPTVWDDTQVIHAEVGELGTIARQSGDRWFVGTINGNEARDIEIPLDFLDDNQAYQAIMYYDDLKVQTKTRVGIQKIEVISTETITRHIKANEGLALQLIPLFH